MEKQYLSVKDLAIYLNLNKHTVYKYIYKNKIPKPVKLFGSRYRWDKDFIIPWIQDTLAKENQANQPIPASSSSVRANNQRGCKQRERQSAQNVQVDAQSNRSYNRVHLALLKSSPENREDKSELPNNPDNEDLL
ncbi:MAG: helix-turn-helix domain-containing protein [Deltaproteobacteria bacterium]|jgi:excisionase family DNA binding protein|nr:helix-turn-helix domain-containing protein [Deltaproteobacteria bacterium]